MTHSTLAEILRRWSAIASSHGGTVIVEGQHYTLSTALLLAAVNIDRAARHESLLDSEPVDDAWRKD